MKEEIVTKKKIACYGGTPSSHPKIWLQIDPVKGEACCPYCETRFVLTEDKSVNH